MRRKKDRWAGTLRIAKHPDSAPGGYAPGLVHLFTWTGSLWRSVCGAPEHQYVSLYDKIKSLSIRCKRCEKISQKIRSMERPHGKTRKSTSKLEKRYEKAPYAPVA